MTKNYSLDPESSYSFKRLRAMWAAIANTIVWIRMEGTSVFRLWNFNVVGN